MAAAAIAPAPPARSRSVAVDPARPAPAPRRANARPIAASMDTAPPSPRLANARPLTVSILPAAPRPRRANVRPLTSITDVAVLPPPAKRAHVIRTLAAELLDEKDPDYTDVMEETAVAAFERPAERPVPLDHREMYRIIREVSKAHSGDDGYSAVRANPPSASGRRFGLCYGIVLFTQESGRLGSALRLMRQREPEVFDAVFGTGSADLITVTTAATAEERLAPVAGSDLWSDEWIARFKEAGEHPRFQAGQNEEAIEGQFRPILRFANDLGLVTDRGLAMAYDRVVVQGVGGAARWLVAAAGAFHVDSQRQFALKSLGFDNVSEFQAAIPGQVQNGIFGPQTHAALMAAIRRQGSMPMPSGDDLMGRLAAASTGAARTRLIRLRESAAFNDVELV